MKYIVIGAGGTGGSIGAYKSPLSLSISYSFTKVRFLFPFLIPSQKSGTFSSPPAHFHGSAA